MKKPEKKIWFPAKTCGWGWGPPVCWQGGVVLIAYVALLSAGAFLIDPQTHKILFTAHVSILTALLLVICFLKGEKPEWRWGPKKK